MEFILLISGIVAILLFLEILHHFIKTFKTSTNQKRDLPLILIGIIYLLFAIILFIASREEITFSNQDSLLMYSLVLLTQTISLIFILRRSIQTKKIFYSLITYLIISPLIFSNPPSFHLIIPISYFIILLSFLILADSHQKMIPRITIYASISIIFYILILVWPNLTNLLNLFSMILFLNFLLAYTSHLRKHPQIQLVNNLHIDSPLIGFLKHFIFIIVITNFILVGTIGVHELGHLTTAKFANCSDAKIVYEIGGFPHTEVNCEDTTSLFKWTLGGIFAPLIISLLLLFVGGKFIRELALQVIGFNLIISYLDLIELTFSRIFSTFIFMTGIVLVIFSLGLLANSRIN